MNLELTGNVLEDPRNASGGCFINGCSLIPPLFAGENPAGASNGGGGGELEELRHISHSSEKKQQVCRPRLLKVGTYLFIVCLSPALCFQFEQIGLPLTHTCPSTAWLLFPKLCVV